MSVCVIVHTLFKNCTYMYLYSIHCIPCFWLFSVEIIKSSWTFCPPSLLCVCIFEQRCRRHKYLLTYLFHTCPLPTKVMETWRQKPRWGRSRRCCTPWSGSRWCTSTWPTLEASSLPLSNTSTLSSAGLYTLNSLYFIILYSIQFRLKNSLLRKNTVDMSHTFNILPNKMRVRASRLAKEGNAAVDQGGHLVLPGRGGGQPEQPGKGQQGGQPGVWQGHQQKVKTLKDMTESESWFSGTAWKGVPASWRASCISQWRIRLRKEVGLACNNVNTVTIQCKLYVHPTVSCADEGALLRWSRGGWVNNDSSPTIHWGWQAGGGELWEQRWQAAEEADQQAGQEEEEGGGEGGSGGV